MKKWFAGVIVLVVSSAVIGQDAKATLDAAAKAMGVSSLNSIEYSGSGSSYNSNSDMRVHFGLGTVTKIDDLQIRWPTGFVERFGNLRPDGIHTLVEGTGSKVKPEPKLTS